jgi:ubiquinone/menaquinone biosynthesis C-methylase UbiE
LTQLHDVAKRLLVADTSNATTSAVGLPESYRRWRESRLGQITDALEERLLLDLLGPVRGLSVLDVGCGDGVLASALARRGARVTGLDTDPQMLAAAHHRAKSESIELRLVRGRAEALPFEGETFDRVVAVTVLCFVRETDRAISEIARILKPGGRLVIGELGRWSLWAAIRRVKGWLEGCSLPHSERTAVAFGGARTERRQDCWSDLLPAYRYCGAFVGAFRRLVRPLDEYRRGLHRSAREQARS